MRARPLRLIEMATRYQDQCAVGPHSEKPKPSVAIPFNQTIAPPAEKREERYRQIVEVHPDPICRFLPDGTLTFVNSAYCAYFGRAEEDLIGTSFFCLMSREQRTEVLEQLSLLQRCRPDPAYEHRTEVAPGEFRWVKWIARGIFDEEGRVTEVQAVGRDVTDRKVAEIALKESEARYASLIRAVPDGVVAYDPDGQATYVNDGFFRLYGWTEQEVLGKAIDFVPDEELARTLDAWHKTFRGEEVFFETRRRTKDGRLLDIQLRTAVLVDQAGRVTESLVIHRDITERKGAEEELQRAHDQLERRVEERTAQLAQTNQQLRHEIAERQKAQEQLRESESRHRGLVENAPLGIISCDIQGRIVQVNANLLQIIGSPSPEETKATNLITYPPLVEAGISSEVLLCIETRGARVFECNYESKWGKSAWLRVHMAPTRDASGSVNGVQAVVEDISDQKNAQSALSESEGRLSAVFDTAQDCIFLKDRDLKYTHVNPAFLKALDFSEADVKGRTDDEIFGPQQAGYVKDLEVRVLAGQIVEATYALTTRSIRKTFHCIRVPMKGSAGEPIGICGIARDVTERKALERGCGRSPGKYHSTVMEATLEQIRRAALSESIVLLLGASGAGKDYLAKYLHDHSRRAGGQFFAINCAALAVSIAESELFGHEAGSFTGSRGRKRGLLEMAEGGTLLLNEIGELSQEVQAKLLTFLDTQSFTRVGGDKTIKVNARIVAATNRDLEREVAAGRFREDLYYRLNVFAIRVPSLRERKDDIPFLSQDLLETLSIKLGRGTPLALDEAALHQLTEYHWPGNVRELRNVLERAVILCTGDIIRAEDINLPSAKTGHAAAQGEIPVSVSVSRGCNMNQALESAKRLMVVSALRRCGGNVSSAARLLGVSRDAVRYHIKALDLDVER